MIAPPPATPPTPRHGDLTYLTYAVADTERARAFYSAVLGWAFRPGRVEDSWQIDDTYPPAGMHGGASTAGIEPVYYVDDLEAALAAVREHGGQAGEPQQQPYGRIAECVDDQGARFQLLCWIYRPHGISGRSLDTGGDSVEGGGLEGENARDAVNYVPVRALGRVGLAAYGVVHLLMAWLAVQVALFDGGTADKSGALKTLASGSAGRALLWWITAGFASVVIWQFSEAIWGQRHVSSVHRRLWRRAFNIGEAMLFGLLAFSAGSIAAGGSPISDADQRSMTATILALPGGQLLVGVIGLGIVAAAGGLVYHGLTKAFLHDMDLSSAGRWATRLATRLGQIGWTALGVAYGTAGELVVLAARQSAPQEATGLDRALKSLATESYGEVLLLVVAAGVACFGVYCLFDARYRRS